MKLFTIGFTQKSAQTFFDLLEKNGVECLVDIRRNHPSLTGHEAGPEEKCSFNPSTNN